jgi:uncharacterized SAM-binding protein YcdF (DUF218 family)
VGLNLEGVEGPPPKRGRFFVGLLVGLVCGLIGKELGLRGMVSYWGPQAPVIVGIGLLTALLWKTKLRVLVAIYASLLVSLWLAVVFSPLSQRLAAPLVRKDAPVAADAIFVLSSNVQIDGDPSPTALSRATRGLELLGQGQAPRMFVSELPPPAGSYAEYVRRSATKLALPHADAISSVGQVRNTHDEALAMVELFNKNHWHTLLLVTSPTHSLRSARTFERAGVPQVISVPATETLVDIEDLRHPDDRTFSFGMIVHEWIGLWYYKLRGWA